MSVGGLNHRTLCPRLENMKIRWYLVSPCFGAFCKCAYMWYIKDILITFWKIGKICSWPALAAPLFPGSLPSRSTTVYELVYMWGKKKKISDLWKICWTAVSYNHQLSNLLQPARVRGERCLSSPAAANGLTYRWLFHSEPVQSPVVGGCNPLGHLWDKRLRRWENTTEKRNPLNRNLQRLCDSITWHITGFQNNGFVIKEGKSHCAWLLEVDLFR